MSKPSARLTLHLHDLKMRLHDQHFCLQARHMLLHDRTMRLHDRHFCLQARHMRLHDHDFHLQSEIS